MRLLRRRRQAPREALTPTPIPGSARGRKSSPAPLEVKLLALEALATGLSRKEVADIVGVAAVTIGAWQRQYDTGGLAGLYRKASSIAVRQRCSRLEERIVAHRREHSEHGMRRA